MGESYDGGSEEAEISLGGVQWRGLHEGDMLELRVL